MMLLPAGDKETPAHGSNVLKRLMTGHLMLESAAKEIRDERDDLSQAAPSPATMQFT